MGMLTDKELEQLQPAESAAYPSPIPTQVVSSDEYFPIAQTERQKQVEARLDDLSDEYGRKNGLSRRTFFKTAAGMATAFAEMNDVYGPLYGVSRVEWTSDLAETPAKYGVTNVYADLGQIFAQTTVVEPRLCAALMGMLIKGMGADHVVWGTDAVWTGAPQWQIEALRRLEIPDEMQKKYGYAPLGPADGPVKIAIFGETSAKMYKYDLKKAGWENDTYAQIKAAYLQSGPSPSHQRYGYVVKG